MSKKKKIQQFYTRQFILFLLSIIFVSLQRKHIFFNISGLFILITFFIYTGYTIAYDLKEMPKVGFGEPRITGKFALLFGWMFILTGISIPLFLFYFFLKSL